jgi:hypothetical protein
VFGEPGFEAVQAHAAFHRLAGEYINGYAFGDLGKLKRTIKLVQSENVEPADFGRIYPAITFVDPTSWIQNSRQVSADYERCSPNSIRTRTKSKRPAKPTAWRGSIRHAVNRLRT